MLSYHTQSLRNTSIVEDYIPANDVASIKIVNTVHTFDASLAMDTIMLFMYFYKRVSLIIQWWVSTDSIVSKTTTRMPLRKYLAKRL